MAREKYFPSQFCLNVKWALALCYQAPSDSDAGHSENAPPSYCYQLSGQQLEMKHQGQEHYPVAVLCKQCSRGRTVKSWWLESFSTCLQLVEFIGGLIGFIPFGLYLRTWIGTSRLFLFSVQPFLLWCRGESFHFIRKPSLLFWWNAHHRVVNIILNWFLLHSFNIFDNSKVGTFLET